MKKAIYILIASVVAGTSLTSFVFAKNNDTSSEDGKKPADQIKQQLKDKIKTGNRDQIDIRMDGEVRIHVRDSFQNNSVIYEGDLDEKERKELNEIFDQLDDTLNDMDGDFDEKLDKKLDDAFDELDRLTSRLKQNHGDKVIRLDSIRKIVRIKKNGDKTYMPIFYNGEELKTDTPPLMRNDRILVPLRAVVEALGAEVQYTPAQGSKGPKVIIKKSFNRNVIDNEANNEKVEVIIDVDKGTATVNGKPVDLDVKAEIYNNRTMVPMRFIAEAFRQYVEWDEESGSAIIESDD